MASETAHEEEKATPVRVVESHAAVRSALAQVLERAGCRVVNDETARIALVSVRPEDLKGDLPATVANMAETVDIFLLLGEGVRAEDVAAWPKAGCFQGIVRLGALASAIRTSISRPVLDGAPDRIKLGRFVLRPHENILVQARSKDPIRLTEKERDLLLHLVRAEGKPISRESLLDLVWAYAEGVETHTLETHIYRLRQKIEKDPANPDLLLTDDEGYRLKL